MLYMLETFCEFKSRICEHFSKFNRLTLKNHCTNTRLVCTHLNAFFMLNPNMAIRNWISTFFYKSSKNLTLSVVDTCEKRVITAILLWFDRLNDDRDIKDLSQFQMLTLFMLKFKYQKKLGFTILSNTGWKNVYFPGSKPNFPQFEFCFYVQKGKISLQIPKFPSTYQYFSGMSFPNSPFFLTMQVSKSRGYLDQEPLD